MSDETTTRESLMLLLRALKLPAFAHYHEEVAQKAEREGWTFGHFLHHLEQVEIDERRQRRVERYLKH
jgi:DNA replication protein DnaC